MSDRIGIATSSERGAVWLRLEGELDLASAGDLEAAVARAVTEQRPRLLALDLDGLEFMDSTGLRAIVLTHRRAQDEGFELVLVCGPGTVRRVLQVSGIDEHIRVVAAPGDVKQPG